MPRTKATAAKKTATKKPTKARSTKVAAKSTATVTKTARKPKTKSDDKTKRTSAIDAAFKVLGEKNESMNAKQMVEVMSAKGYWTSPGGLTPHATLYSAIIREINAKGNESRFVKKERGQFAAR